MSKADDHGNPQWWVDQAYAMTSYGSDGYMHNSEAVTILSYALSSISVAIQELNRSLNEPRCTGTHYFPGFGTERCRLHEEHAGECSFPAEPRAAP